MGFTNKVALITGGGSGINLAFTQLLVARDCRVLIADLALHPTAKTWLSSLPAPTRSLIHFHRTDVTSWPDLSSALTACETHFHRTPDIVVPGAGVYEPSSNSFWADLDSESESRYKVLDINLTHPIKLSRLAIASFIKAKKSGTIVHLSSIAGQRSSIVTPLYTASKHALNSFVRGMAPLEQLFDIRVLAVAPGTVGTPLFKDHPEAAKFLDMEKDFLLPVDEVARAMMALVEERERYKGGTVLEVCDVQGRWREVELLNDPGPRGPASLTSRKADAVEELVRMLDPEGTVRRDKSRAERVVTD
ncbi:Short chain dehydrogenase-like protein 54 [Elsinoe fawcettii]|nr:Short chain dehydrogenase-like protein 54 [Elsinoe fawcettii]